MGVNQPGEQLWDRYPALGCLGLLVAFIGAQAAALLLGMAFVFLLPFILAALPVIAAAALLHGVIALVTGKDARTEAARHGAEAGALDVLMEVIKWIAHSLGF